MTTTDDLPPQDFEECAGEVSEYLSSYSNWGDEGVLPPIDGCAVINLDGTEFVRDDQGWICNTEGWFL